ncbi:hypothetical protein V8J36_16215 [Frigidibacter sp. MR17.14]|uniref:hypothetical protein n=1 Tax=Frigidibacter sp. MR17.14 TaxID=3126509 RepID=UPI0030130EF2
MRASLLVLPLLAAALPATAQTDLAALPRQDRIAVFAAAEAAHAVGQAKKTKAIDARPAKPGEVVVTKILGEGTETTSKPAAEGDWVVRNRCPETGNEEYLVAAAKFAPRYGAPTSAADAAGWQAFTPLGKPMDYTIVPEGTAPYAIEAPWGEAMRVAPGDALMRTPGDAADIYRVERRAFACTYEIITAP